MGITYIDIESMDWLEVTDAWSGKVDPGEPDVRFKQFETGSDVVPRGQLVQYERGHCERAHSHRESELLFILDGDATVAGVPVRPGALIYIEGGTTYGPIQGGENGLRFLRLHVGRDGD
jgi:hypothetical protein